MYECYKPGTLEEVREYVDFVLSARSILPNDPEDTELDPDSEEPELPRTPRRSDFDPQTDLSACSQKLRSFWETEGEKRKGKRKHINESVDPRAEQYLWFDSCFECGNLSKVIAVSPSEYELYLCSDTNSGHRYQWFYFMVTNTKKNQTAKFVFMNATKFPHFYKEGMRPLVFSEKDNQAMYTSWTFKTDNLTVTKCTTLNSKHSGARYILLESGDKLPEDTSSPSCSYVLSFTHTFKYDADRVYFAFNKPYTYTRLKQFLGRAERALAKEASRMSLSSQKDKASWMLPEVQIETRDIFYNREQCSRSLGGIPVDLITITSNSPCSLNSTGNKTGEEAGALNKPKYVIITARVHASETPGSYKVQGILKFLLSADPVAESLRREFVFLIVPMLNPDGVVLGNNRCSLGGFDLNRCWGNPSRNRQPTVHGLKRRLQALTSGNKQIAVFCDLHGHSKLLNSFVYACHQVSAGSLNSWTRVRLLPRVLAKKCHFVDFRSCSFRVEANKLNTARVIVWKEFKVINSFTMETSIYGYTLGDEVVQFADREYVHVGRALMQALHDYQLLIADLPADSADPRDWVPSSKLAQLMGLPAADALKLEIQVSKEEEKKRERRERQRVRLQMTKIPSFPRGPEKANSKRGTSTKPLVAKVDSPSRTPNGPGVTKLETDTRPNVPRDPITDEPKARTPTSTGPLWELYFTKTELEEMAQDFNAKLENDGVADLALPPLDPHNRPHTPPIRPVVLPPLVTVDPPAASLSVEGLAKVNSQVKGRSSFGAKSTTKAKAALNTNICPDRAYVLALIPSKSPGLITDAIRIAASTPATCVSPSPHSKAPATTNREEGMAKRPCSGISHGAGKFRKDLGSVMEMKSQVTELAKVAALREYQRKDRGSWQPIELEHKLTFESRVVVCHPKPRQPRERGPPHIRIKQRHSSLGIAKCPERPERPDRPETSEQATMDQRTTQPRLSTFSSKQSSNGSSPIKRIPNAGTHQKPIPSRLHMPTLCVDVTARRSESLTHGELYGTMQPSAEIASASKANQSYTFAEGQPQTVNKGVASSPKVALQQTQTHKVSKKSQNARTLPAQIALPKPKPNPNPNPTSSSKPRANASQPQTQTQTQKQKQKQKLKQKRKAQAQYKNGMMLITPGINTSPLHLDSVISADHAGLMSSKDSSTTTTTASNALSNLFANPRSKAFLYDLFSRSRTPGRFGCRYFK